MRQRQFQSLALAAVLASVGLVSSFGQLWAQEGQEGREGKVRYSYADWLKTVEVPILEGYAVFDVFTEKLYDWPSKGGKGVYVHLSGNKMMDAYLIEIPPGGSLKPERHLYEEFVYYLTGNGATVVQQKDRREERVEWKAGALFSPPLNVSHQHLNSSDKEPARLLVVTSLPFMIQTGGNQDFLVQTDFAFRDRYNAEEKYFGLSERTGMRDWRTNFIASVADATLESWNERGKGSTNMNWDMADNIMLQSHTSEIPAGYYKLAHRHRNEAIILQLSGAGYSLLWEKAGDKKEQVRWKAGSLYSPPIYWYHQHFDVSDEPARYLAFPNAMFMSRLGVGDSDQIELEDEDAIVREIWQRETAKR